MRILRGLFYAFVSSLSGLLVGVAILAILATIPSVAINDGIIWKSVYQDLIWGRDFLTPIKYDGSWSYITIFVTLFLLVSFWQMYLTLKIINPSLGKLKGLKWKTFLVVFRFGSNYWLASVFWLFLYWLLGFIFWKAPWSVIPSLLVYFIYPFFWLPFFVHWHAGGMAGDLLEYAKKPKERVSFFNLVKSIRNGFVQSRINKKAFALRIFSLGLISSFVSGRAMALVTGQISEIGMGVGIESSLVNHKRFIFLSIIGFVLSASVNLPLIYAFLGNLKSSYKEIMIKLVPVAFLAVIVFSLSVQDLMLKDARDYSKYFLKETGVSLRNPKDLKEEYYNTSIIFGDKIAVGNTFISVSPYTNRDSAENEKLIKQRSAFSFKEIKSGFTGENLFEDYKREEISIICNQENIEKVKKINAYLEKKNYKSFLSVDYFWVLKGCYKFNWEFDKYLDSSRLSFESTGNMFDGLLSNTIGAKYDQNEVKKYVSSVNNPKYHFGGKSTLRVADKLYYYGETNESDKWLKMSGKDKLSIRNVPDFHEGIISGSISGDFDKGKIKIGLFKAGEEAGSYIGFSIDSGIKDRIKLVDSIDLDVDGKFVFNNLFSGNYVLGVLVKERKLSDKDLDISSSLKGNIKITREEKVKDLGEIKIKMKKQAENLDKK